MSATYPTIDPSHPLALDRARLERIKDRTYSFIAAQLREEALLGGEDAHDVVQEVLLSLLKKPVDYTENWERLAMTIAKARLKDAYRRARRGREHHDDYEAQRDPNRNPDAINVLPLGSPAADNGLDELTVAGRLNWEVDPDLLVEEAECQAELWELAQQVLSERELIVYTEVHHKRTGRSAVAGLIDRTPRRISQMIIEIHRKLVAATVEDPRFPTGDDGADP